MLAQLTALIAAKAQRLQREEKGVTIPEYAIMLALVAIAVVLAAPNISDAVVTVFTEAANAMAIVP